MDQGNLRTILKLGSVISSQCRDDHGGVDSEKHRGVILDPRRKRIALLQLRQRDIGKILPCVQIDHILLGKRNIIKITVRTLSSFLHLLIFVAIHSDSENRQGDVLLIILVNIPSVPVLIIGIVALFQ